MEMIIDAALRQPMYAALAVLVVLLAVILVLSLRSKPKLARRDMRLPEDMPPQEDVRRAPPPASPPAEAEPPPIAASPSPPPPSPQPEPWREDDGEPVIKKLERLERPPPERRAEPRRMEAPAREARPAEAPAVGSDHGDHYAVTVYFGTDRRETSLSDPRQQFTDERARPPRGQTPMTYGSCRVTIPKSHKIGELEAPSWYDWRGEQEDKHVILHSIRTSDRLAFLANLRRAMTDERHAFVFVHGFSVSFEDAARRTAQMAFDMKFRGVPVFFSWPTEVLSVLKPLAYSEAENNARWATEHFRAFLADVIKETGAETVHLIAHSMGNRIVTDALMQLYWQLTPAEKKVIGEVILTAPDIDAEVFVDQIAPRITAMDSRVTLYTSAGDNALKTSRTVHGYPRAGDFAALTFLPDNVDVIDASDVETDSLGHAYYGDAQSVMSDICHLMVARVPAHARTLTLKGLISPASQPYWSVRKETTLEQVWASLSGGPRRIV